MSAKRPRARLSLAFSLLILGAGLAGGEEQEPESMLPRFPYAHQGPFVSAPARAIAAPVFGAGFLAGALVCAPVSIAQDPRMEGRVPYDQEASIICGKGLGTFLGWPVYAAVGLPLYLLKGLFWDGPRALAAHFKQG